MPIRTTVNDLLLDPIAISVRGVTGSFLSTSRKPYPLRSTTRPSWMIPRASPGTCHSVIWDVTNWSKPDSARGVAGARGVWASTVRARNGATSRAARIRSCIRSCIQSWGVALFYPPLRQSATRQGDPTPAPESNASTRELARVLRLSDVILIVVGTVIGSGIFLVPGSVLREAGGDVGLALLVWIVGGVLSLLGALTYAELGAMNPRAGGLYVYLRDAFGPLPAFLYGWALFFVIGSGSIATLAAAFARYVQQFVALDPLSA